MHPADTGARVSLAPYGWRALSHLRWQGFEGTHYAVTVYSECAFADAPGASSGDAWECEVIPPGPADFEGGLTWANGAWANGGHGPVCPFRKVVEKMDKMEKLIDERMKLLDSLLDGTEYIPNEELLKSNLRTAKDR